VKNRYEPAYPKLTQFLQTVGRRKYIKPIYEEMAKTSDGRERALRIYHTARPAYHPIAQTSIDAVLKSSM
jgi:leukotriene-A4 hydrolase